MRIDIVSDVVCPWCIIGYQQLERALELTGIDAEIHWHPFELNPDMAGQGENLRDHVARKYGAGPEDSKKARERITAMGAELGFTFNYAEDMRMVNTFRAHQLIHWAGTLGRQHDAKMALFGAFFTDRRDLNDPEVLAEVADSIGLDREEARAALTEGRYAEAVRDAERVWISRGVQGVPTMIFDQRYAVSGAQGVDRYVSLLRQASLEVAS